MQLMFDIAGGVIIGVIGLGLLYLIGILILKCIEYFLTKMYQKNRPWDDY